LSFFKNLRRYSQVKVSTTPVANLPPVPTTPAAKLPPVSTSRQYQRAAGINDTGGKFCHPFR
jgi:hypothetical protein